jgi:hypothetical protein
MRKNYYFGCSIKCLKKPIYKIVKWPFRRIKGPCLASIERFIVVFQLQCSWHTYFTWWDVFIHIQICTSCAHPAAWDKVYEMLVNSLFDHHVLCCLLRSDFMYKTVVYLEIKCHNNLVIVFNILNWWNVAALIWLMIYITSPTKELATDMWNICIINSETFVAFMIKTAYCFQMPFKASPTIKTSETIMAFHFVVWFWFATTGLYSSAILASS